MTSEESRAVSFLVVLLLLAALARFLARPDPITISAAPIDVAALRAAGQALAQQGPPSRKTRAKKTEPGAPKPIPVFIEDPRPAEQVNLNRASAEELDALPGIGPAMAARIIARRDSVRGFRRLEDLDSIRGIGPALIAKLRPLVVVR